MAPGATQRENRQSHSVAGMVMAMVTAPWCSSIASIRHPVAPRTGQIGLAISL
jgi:hypothetical protein